MANLVNGPIGVVPVLVSLGFYRDPGSGLVPGEDRTCALATGAAS